jgi:3'-phosphoadenosine 5'-phosphosulfate (PAPS) 3'-phosphatase
MSGEHPVRLTIPPFTRDTLNLIESAKPSEALKSLNHRVAATLGITRAHVFMDSMSTYSSVARGDGAAYIRFTTRVGYEEKIWVRVPFFVSHIRYAQGTFTRPRTMLLVLSW